MEVTQKTLTETLQEELQNPDEVLEDENKETIRQDTIRWLIQFLKDDELPTPKPGNRTEPNEPAIYPNEVQTLNDQTQEKLQLISQIVDKASKATLDEKQARVELSNFEAECEHIHGSLTEKVE